MCTRRKILLLIRRRRSGRAEMLFPCALRAELTSNQIHGNERASNNGQMMIVSDMIERQNETGDFRLHFMTEICVFN